MTIFALDEAGPFVDHEPSEGIPWPWASYRSCDYCQETACEDIWSGKINQEDWRRFYLLQDGTCVCEHCVPTLEDDS